MSILTAAISIMALLSCSEGVGQTEADADERSITVQERVDIDCAAAAFSINVKSNFEFQVESQVDWIVFDKTEGNEVWFTAQANDHTTERMGKVKFTDPEDRFFYKEV